jgi:hypothetical protein
VYTAVFAKRMSIESIPQTPSTFQTNGQTSSGEDDREPQTPKPEDDVAPKEIEASKEARSDLKIEDEHERTPVAVA